MKLLDLFNFSIDDILLEAILPSHDTIYNLTKNNEYDTNLPFCQQVWFKKDKNKQSLYKKLAREHLIALRYETENFIKSLKYVNPKSVTYNNSTTISNQDNLPSLSTYIDFTTTNNAKGKIRISDHTDKNPNNINKNIFYMWYGTVLTQKIKQRLTNYVNTIYKNNMEHPDEFVPDTYEFQKHIKKPFEIEIIKNKHLNNR